MQNYAILKVRKQIPDTFFLNYKAKKKKSAAKLDRDVMQ